MCACERCEHVRVRDAFAERGWGRGEVLGKEHSPTIMQNIFKTKNIHLELYLLCKSTINVILFRLLDKLLNENYSSREKYGENRLLTLPLLQIHYGSFLSTTNFPYHHLFGTDHAVLSTKLASSYCHWSS